MRSRNIKYLNFERCRADVLKNIQDASATHWEVVDGIKYMVAPTTISLFGNDTPCYVIYTGGTRQVSPNVLPLLRRFVIVVAVIDGPNTSEVAVFMKRDANIDWIPKLLEKVIKKRRLDFLESESSPGYANKLATAFQNHYWSFQVINSIGNQQGNPGSAQSVLKLDPIGTYQPYDESNVYFLFRV